MSPSETKGILIMPLSTNGASMQNVLEVLHSTDVLSRYSLPAINKVCFLKSSDCSTVCFEGEDLPAYAAVGRMMERINPIAEFRIVPICEYAGDVPEVILAAAKEVGRAKIILDLTAGKKDITGSLYTSACLAEIENTIYVDVHRDPNTRSFFTIRRDDQDILDKVTIIKFKSISEIERLASLNMKDFIFYKKHLESIVPKDDEATSLHFQNAIACYFKRDQDSYQNCIRDIGLINESVLARIASFLRANCSPYAKVDKPDLITVYAAQQHYEKTIQDGTAHDDDNAFCMLCSLFSRFPACFEMISMIRNYRNLVSHNKGFTPCRDDAKLVLDTMLRILRSLSEVKMN